LLITFQKLRIVSESTEMLQPGDDLYPISNLGTLYFALCT